MQVSNRTNPQLNLVGCSNVVIPSELHANVQTAEALYHTLFDLTNSRPQWKFQAHDHTSNTSYTTLRGFTILEDGEELGTVRLAYKGSGYKICVDNDRINAKRQYGRGYWTEDTDKAALAIRKNFFKRDKTERLSKALEAAGGVIASEYTTKHYERYGAKNSLFSDHQEFIEAHMQEYLAEHPKMQSYYDTFVQATAQFEVIDSVKDAFDNAKATLVVLDGTHYMLKEAATPVAVMTDSELSFDVRRKLGLLKLVEDRQMISGVGCRVDATTFVLLPD